MFVLFAIIAAFMGEWNWVMLWLVLHFIFGGSSRR